MSEAKKRRREAQTFRLMMDRSVLHLRVDDRTRYHGIFLVGTAREMHGEGGCCTCCWGRAA